MSPRFYNVRLQYVPCEHEEAESSEEAELKVEGKVDEQVGTYSKFSSPLTLSPLTSSQSPLPSSTHPSPLPNHLSHVTTPHPHLPTSHLFSLPHTCNPFSTPNLSPLISPLQACRLLLTLPVPPDDSSDKPSEAGKGYDLFIAALISLMGVGTDYTHQNRTHVDRVLQATAAHQCFSLTMGMLGTLPPCYRVLSAMVGGQGLSVVVSEFGLKHVKCQSGTHKLFGTHYRISKFHYLIQQNIWAPKNIFV